jgi:RNA polymerase sigma factor (TIGR02999 family)
MTMNAMPVAPRTTETALGARSDFARRHLPGGLEAEAPQSNVTGWVAPADHDDPAGAEALFASLYVELHRIARREVARRGGYVTLGATTLLHEAYLDVSDREGMVFPDRPRFLAYAARAMRGLAIDHVRRRHAQKRGGLFELTTLDTAIADNTAGEEELQHIGDALDELASVDATLAEVVDLKFFCGFSFAEIGAMHGVSERTVQRQWEKARLYLHRVIADSRSRPTNRRPHTRDDVRWR